MNKLCGIYKIESNLFPDRIYIGSAININARRSIHLHYLRKNKHHSQKLQRHYNKYKESDLIFSILLECEKENLIKNEQIFIDAYKPYFNCCPNAGSPLGRKVSEITKQKLRDFNTGRHPSMETRLKQSILMKTIIPKHDWNRGKPSWNKGLKMKEETRLKLLPILRERAKKRIGTTVSQEIIIKRINTRTKNANWNTSITTRQKMSRPIIQTDIEGNTIKEFWGASEVAELFSLSANNINRVCRGERKSYHNLYFKYKPYAQ